MTGENKAFAGTDSLLLRGAGLSPGLVDDLLRMNPWWQGKPMPPLPPIRRHLVGQMDARLERALAPITVLRGPRQIGKTTAHLQLIRDLLGRGVAPARILRLQCDELPEIRRLPEPILRVVDWFERAILKKTLNEAAHE
ncbi:MAG: hypothetical protein FJ279_25205, partial [Planctomycetes bacterium]|nr:hypothetical protein [Planctomycetota bacterium]